MRDLSEGAFAAGVRIGMRIREAQVRCPDAVFLAADESAAAGVQERLLSLLEQFSPDVEDVRPGVALFEATGWEVRYPSEEALGLEIVEALRRESPASWLGKAAAQEPDAAPELAVGGESRAGAAAHPRGANLKPSGPDEPPPPGSAGAPPAPVMPSAGSVASKGPTARRGGEPGGRDARAPLPPIGTSQHPTSTPIGGRGPREAGRVLPPYGDHPPVAASNPRGVQVRVGVAGTRFCARVAAAYARPVLVIAPDGERAFLAPLPVTHLPGLERWYWRLQFLGIRTIGDYAARLPYNDVLVRYGPEAAQAHVLARGLDPSPLQPRRLRELPTAVHCFEPAEERLEPLVFALKRRLDEMCAGLEEAGWGCGLVRLDCTCEAGEDVRLLGRPAEPTASPARLIDLLRWQIERRQEEAQQANKSIFDGGVTRFTLQLDQLAPAAGQALSLFSGGRAGKHNVIAAIERLETLLGPGSVRQAVLTSDRRPEEAFTWAPYRPALAPPGGKRAGRSASRPARVTAAARVQPAPLATVADGRPSLLDGNGKAAHIPAMRLLDPARPAVVKERDGAITAIAVGRGSEAVVDCTGPWRLAERWWQQASGREYFQLYTRLGRVYLLYQETGAWFLQGVFD